MSIVSTPSTFAVATFVMAAVITALVVPCVRSLGLTFGLTDLPAPRKQHQSPIVRIGGIGMVLGFCFSLAIIWSVGGFGLLAPEKDQLIWSTLAGALCFFVIGFADDLFVLSPWPRLICQLAIAFALWTQGVRIGEIEIPLIGQENSLIALPTFLSIGITMLWLVGITNAINWLDGLDGLAAGVAGIGAVSLVSVCFSLDQIAAGFLAAALAGSCFGFLRHNFNPAGIFMGDGGSYFLGFSLAAISIVGPAKGLTTVSLIMPLMIFSLPLADMSAVIMGRLKEGHSPFYPDRRHLHHRLVKSGLSHKRTVLLIYVFTQWLGALALVVANTEMRFLWLALATAILITTIINIRRQKVSRKMKSNDTFSTRRKDVIETYLNKND